MLHDFKTILLSSRDRVSGTPEDCFIEIKEGILDSTKKYVCELVWIAFEAPGSYPSMKTMYLVVDGFFYPDAYSSRPIRPFALIDTRDWATSANTAIMYEPENHRRKVFVRTNQLRVQAYLGSDFSKLSDYGGVVGGNWTMELRFTEIPQELEF